MPRKLKTFQTSLGFYDLANAAPSMKAALEAWGAGNNLCVAKETDDPEVVAATISKPGVVLKRPAGSSGRFAEHSELPFWFGWRRGWPWTREETLQIEKASGSEDRRSGDSQGRAGIREGAEAA